MELHLGTESSLHVPRKNNLGKNMCNLGHVGAAGSKRCSVLTNADFIFVVCNRFNQDDKVC